MKKIKLSVIIIMMGTMISKILGLLRDVILASSFGASAISDAYLISVTIPSLLVGAIATAIMSTYIPVLNSAIKEDGEIEANNFNNNAVSISLAIVTLFLLIFFMFPDFFVSIFVLGFNDKDLDLVINMTKVTVFMSYFLVLISIFSGYLQNKGKFKATSFNGIIFNVVSIAGIMLSVRYNVMIMAYTFVLGYMLATLQLFYQARKCGLRLKVKFNLKNKYIKKLLILTLPVILNSVVWDINVMIDKTLTSTIGTGYVSGLNYSFKLINVATDIIAVSVATFIFPKISKLFQNKDEDGLISTLFNSLNLVTILLIPITAAFIIFAEPVVSILFMRGNFDSFALEVTTNSLRIYSLLLITTGINTIIYKCFNAMELNKIPAMNAMVSVIFNIILNLIFIKPFGYKGVIMATVISTLIACIMILFKLKKKINGIFFKPWIKNLFKSAVATLLASIAGIYLYSSGLFSLNLLVNLICSGCIYMIIYFVILYLLNFRVKNIML